MQTRVLARKVERMALYRKRHSLRQTAIRFGIYGPDGKPSKGLTSRLLSGYEPRLPETRKRLGLPETIPAPRRTINQHLAGDRLQDMPAPLLAWALSNRKEVE